MTISTVFEEKRLYIGGKWIEPSGSETLEVHSPASEELVGVVAVANDADVDRAVAAARTAFDTGPWRTMSVSERVAVVEQMCDYFEANLLDEAVGLVIREMGIPLKISRPVHQMMAIQNVRNACKAALGVEIETARDGDIQSIIRLEPVGVVASIAPWNGPLVQALYMIVYPLLSGCSVVMKPAPETPMSVVLVARAFDAVGLPEGVLSILAGGADVGARMVAHSDVDFVFFTGSTETGRKIGAIAGDHMKRTVLELGGKSAAIILDDADLAEVIPNLVGGAFGNTGQNCAALSRVLVPAAMLDDVVQQLSTAADSLVVGDPMDEATDIGPLVSRKQLEKVTELVDRALEAGATVANAPAKHGSPGWYYAPTVLTGMTNDSVIAQSEIFGPVVCVIPYDDESDAVAMANESEFGLHGAVFSRDQERAMTVARAVRTGTMSVNGNFMNTEAPFGGFKQSGVGRKYGQEGFRSFFEVKAINYGTGKKLFEL